MRNLMMGVLIGALGTWLYRSEQIRQLATSNGADGGDDPLASVSKRATSGIAGLLDVAPLPQAAKTRATGAVQSVGAWAGADRGGQQSQPPQTSTVREAPSNDQMVLNKVNAAAKAARQNPPGDLSS
jgi:hypothetical protein